MAEISPSVGDAQYPSYAGFSLTDTWDQGSLGSPNPDWIDSFFLIQIENELLAHQQVLQAGGAQLFAPGLMGTPNINPAVLSELANGIAIMTFVDAATTSILINGQVLDAATDVIIIWSATPTTGNVVWRASYLQTADDADMTAALTDVDVTDAVSGVANGQVETTVPITGLTTTRSLLLKVSRVGADGSDTLTATANVAMVKLRKA